MTVRDTGTPVIRVRPDDSLDNFPGLGGAEVERYDRFRRTGGPISDEREHEENIVEALAMFIGFCNTSEGAVVERAKASAHTLADELSRLRAVLTQQEAARGKVQRLVFNAECALRSTLDRDDAVAIAIVNLTDAVDALTGVRSDG